MSTAPGLSAVEAIQAKRDGGTLTDAQVDWVVDAYHRGVVAEEQMAALAMAILLQGMTASETARWTHAMIDSGVRLDLSGVGRPTVDKHSTGGVGDKITLVLAPLMAACGVAVPQLSGRGLGHTGGTLDKLEAVPGWSAEVDDAAFQQQLRRVGAVVCAAGGALAPVDRRLYALRDVTGTVESVPLIASSIMSKKIATGTGALVLDVKVGSGAFMATVPQATALAELMVALGTAHHVRTVAVLTDMSAPLGRTVGNALEVAEAVEVLAGGGPPDVVTVTLALAREMLAAAGITDVDPADALADGRAMDAWRAMVAAQGGDPDASLPTASESEVVRAESDGTVTQVDARAVGTASWRLGAGRSRRDDPVSAGAGVVLHRRPGDPVTAGEPLCTLHTDDPTRLGGARAAVRQAVRVGAAAPPEHPLVIDRIG